MKKSLTALAAVAVAAGLVTIGSPAVAQSSVTMYGVADAGIGKARADGDRRVHMLSGSTMNNAVSRVGLRGTEDLGSGLKVGFHLEAGLSLNDGASNYSGGQFWSRGANVWIGGDWGTVTLGRRLNPSYDAEWVWELSYGANYSVVEPTYNYLGQGDTRSSSQFMYATPNINGFQAELAYVTRDDNQGHQKFDLALTYEGGPLSVGLGANKTRRDKTNYSVGAQYRLGPFAMAASYARVGNDRWTDPAMWQFRERRRVSLGGRYESGPYTVVLDFTRDLRNHQNIGRSDRFNKKYTNGLLEGRYALSKRTFLYAAYLRLDGYNNWGAGLQHNF